MAGSLIKIREILKELSPSEKKVAQFILNKPCEISSLSIGDLAKNSKSSEATVVRLCKILGFSGYKDFKISITRDIALNDTIETLQNQYSDVEPGDDLKTIVQNISNNNKESIDDTLKILSFDKLQKVIDAIIKANRIDFYGVGASYLIAYDAFQKFSRINKIVTAHSDPHMQIASASNLKKGDVAFAISYSGNTKDTYDSIRVAKESRATTVSITKYGQNSISELCDINLFVSAPEITIRSGAMSSRIAQLNVIDILFAAVASIQFDEVKKYLENTRRVIAIKKI